MAKKTPPGPAGRRTLDGYTHTWRVGDRAWSASASVGCEVVEVGYGSIKVRWDDNDEIAIVHPTDVQVPA